MAAVELSDGEAWELASLDVGGMALPTAGWQQGEQEAGECQAVHHQEQLAPPAAHHLQEVQELE